MLQDLRIHAKLAVAAGATFIPVCTIFVALRVYSRRLVKASLGADDWSIIAALVFVIAMAVALIAEVGLKQLGYAAPAPSDAIGKPDANIAFWPVEILQIPALGLVKASFIFLYRRIFTKRAAPVFNSILWSMLAVIIIWTIAFFFAIVFICGSNFSAYWTSTAVEAAECVKTSELHNGFVVSDFITDVIIIILPVPMILRLHMTPARKVGLVLIFCLGALTIAASTIRMAIYLQATAVNYDPNVDFEYLCTAGLYWSMIESGLGVCACCLPVMASLVKSLNIQSIVNSVRSAISLNSLRSGGSGQRTDGIPTDQPTSQSHIVSSAQGSGQSDSLAELGKPKENEVLVTRSFDQHSA